MQCLNCELPCILRCASSPRRAERPYRSARQPRVRVPFFFIGFHGFKKELQWRTTTNESQSFPPPQPPAFPFLLLFPSLSSSFRQPRLTRSRSRAAPVRPRYSLQCLLLTFTDIFLYIQHNYEAYTHSLTTSLLSYYRIRLSSRDSNVFKWRPRSSRMASQSVCVSLLLYSLSSAFSLIRLSTRRVVWNRCPRHVSHFIVSESSLTLCRAYLLYPPISRKTFPLAAAI